jgi:hypothetical protein
LGPRKTLNGPLNTGKKNEKLNSQIIKINVKAVSITIHAREKIHEKL